MLTLKTDAELTGLGRTVVDAVDAPTVANEQRVGTTAVGMDKVLHGLSHLLIIHWVKKAVCGVVDMKDNLTEP